MDLIQRRILEIALQLPGYLGYEAKERRRDMDKHTRVTLANQYEELHTALARVRAKAPLEQVVELENLDQKLLRLIARLETAPRGYAGWFDAAQIVEEDLDALTQFDAALANGVSQLKAAIDRVATAVNAKQGFDDAVSACAELLDDLNARFNEREQFLATGKKPAVSILPQRQPESPLGALEAKQSPPAALLTLANLKLNDAIEYAATDYLITGKITYTIATGSFWAFLLQDGNRKLWLRVGPGDEIATCKQIQFTVSSPLPETLDYGGETLTRHIHGQAQVSVTGAGGTKRGVVEYACYRAESGARLWIENFGTETRIMFGRLVQASELKVYRRSSE